MPTVAARSPCEKLKTGLQSMMDEEAVVRMFVGLVFCLDDSSCFARSDLRFARLAPLNLWLLLLSESSMGVMMLLLRSGSRWIMLLRTIPLLLRRYHVAVNGVLCLFVDLLF